jgi:hypothetical protein
VSNVLNEEKKQQVIALGRLGWSLRLIEDATGVLRETASSYLKEAGVAVRPPRGRRVHSKPASPEKVTTDFGAEPEGATAPAPAPQPGRSPSASACEPYREMIELRLSLGRNAMAIWQELVDTRIVKGYRRPEWQKTRDRNEALDCRTYARAAAAVYGMDRFTDATWKTLEERIAERVRQIGQPPRLVQPSGPPQRTIRGRFF